MQIDPSRQFRLDERVCFLSGATGHLGRFMAETLAAAGAHVLVNGRNVEKVEELVRTLRSSGWQASSAAFDVTDEGAIQSWVERTEREHRRLDVIVHNATSGRPGTFAEIQALDFEQVYKINVVAGFQLLKAALPLLRNSARLTAGASVINISSMYGIVSPDPSIYGTSGANNPPSYGPAKAGMLQLTRYAACHLAPDHIRVNCLSPGPFPSRQFLERDPEFNSRLRAKVPMGRTGNPNELQGPLLFLASDASSFVTGINLPVDGGWTAW
jgi:NAD(P)-dependent dehydrogenase (short-subunit alcohol dehydrogenase family)